MKKIRRPFAALLDRRYFPALLIVLALAVGMLLPQAVLAVQGVHLEKTDTLLPTGISVGRQSSETAKLDILTRFYNAMENGSGDEIELSRGRYMTAEQVLERVTELKTIADAAGLPFEMPLDGIQSTSGLQYEQYEIQPDDVQRIATPVLVVFNDESSMTSSIVWVAQLYWEKNELNFVVDDETGMILSAYFYLYNNDALVNGRSDETAPAGADETARRLGEALCRSYGFENVTVEAETGSLGDETGLLIAETDYNAEYFAECNIRFALNGETKCRMSLSFEGQNWHFGVYTIYSIG